MCTFRDLITFFSISAFARDCRRRRIPLYCLAFTNMAPSSVRFNGNSTCPIMFIIVVIRVVTGIKYKTIEGLYQKGKAQRNNKHQNKGPTTENTCQLFKAKKGRLGLRVTCLHLYKSNYWCRLIWTVTWQYCRYIQGILHSWSGN